MTQFLCFEDLPTPAGKREGARRFTQSFQIKKGADGCDKCLLVRAACRFEGTAPHISFQMSFPGRETPLYLSHAYPMGGKEFVAQCWRVPPMRTNEITLSVCVEIPCGTVVEIRDFSAVYEESTPRAAHLPPRYNAHLGLVGMAPGNTMPAFELAALCGFHTCIAVPKVTRDGKLVCLHDETINSAARHPDGSELQEKVYVNALTYNELLEYDFGIRKGTLYRGTKIPLLEEFFALCAKTGMKPMFSTHPDLSPEKWREVKEMLTRYGLLQHFHVKAPNTETIADAVAVLGSEIDGYTLDVQRLEDDSIEKMRKACRGAEGCRIGIEIRHRSCTAEAVRQVLDANMFAAVWNLPRCSFEEYDRLLLLGVSEFTEDHHCSMGLALAPMAE